MLALTPETAGSSALLGDSYREISAEVQCELTGRTSIPEAIKAGSLPSCGLVCHTGHWEL